MLVLTRKTGEEIEIDGGRIRLKVLDMKGSGPGSGRTVIGIDAPRDIDVKRAELNTQSRTRGPAE